MAEFDDRRIRSEAEQAAEREAARRARREEAERRRKEGAEDPPKEDPPKEDPPEEDPPVEGAGDDGAPASAPSPIAGRVDVIGEAIDLAGIRGIREQLPDLGIRPDAAADIDGPQPVVAAPVQVVQDAVVGRVESRLDIDAIGVLAEEASAAADGTATEDAAEERDDAVSLLEDFGVEGAADLSDDELRTAVDEVAQKQLLGAESDDDLAVLPTHSALDAIASQQLVGGGGQVNADGSVTLFDAEGEVLIVIAPGAEADGDTLASQDRFDLPDFSPVPSTETLGLIADIEEIGGSAVVHTDGSVDLFDADGELIRHVPPDVASSIGQALETAGEGLATVPEQLAAAPGELAADLDQAGAEIGAAVDRIGEGLRDLIDDIAAAGSGATAGTAADQSQAPAADEPAPPPAEGQEGSAAPAEGDDDDEADDDEDDGGGGDDGGAPADQPAAEAGAGDEGEDGGTSPDVDAAGTPNPEDVDTSRAATEAFLDTPLGAAQRESEQEAVEQAEGGGLVDPAEDDGGGGVIGVDPTTGEATVGPIRTPGGAAGPIIDPGDLVVTARDLDNLAVLAGGGPEAGPIDDVAPPPPQAPQSPITPAGPIGGPAFGIGASPVDLGRAAGLAAGVTGPVAVTGPDAPAPPTEVSVPELAVPVSAVQVPSALADDVADRLADIEIEVDDIAEDL